MKTSTFEERLARLNGAGLESILQRCRTGIEKEALRVTAGGDLADTPHPPALGSALTHRFITTDFAEALLEFVTPAFSNSWESLQFLCDIHQFVYQHLDDEMLWAASMPCLMAGEEEIPVAEYGDSNVGRMKTVYRIGLGHRYGRIMQTIAGVHFNFSLPDDFWPHYQELEHDTSRIQDFRSQAYFGLLRNVRRLGWLILYLFGNSPAVCRCFVDGDAGLEEFDKGTLYLPFATSLRMSDLGYKNSSQGALNISLDDVDSYVDSLLRAVVTPNPDYEAIGVKVDGKYRQISANTLQVENEYYGLIRPKRVARSGEMPTRALKRRGVEYVELRALDVSLFDPAGINQNQMRFLETLLVYCMLEDSPSLSEKEIADGEDNQLRVARGGREQGLKLSRNGPVALKDWALEICDKVMAVAGLIDGDDGGSAYRDAVALQRESVVDPERTPSARILREMRETGQSFFELSKLVSELHKKYFLSLESGDLSRKNFLVSEAKASLTRQSEIEASDSTSFEEYLAAYFAQAAEKT